MLTDFEKFFAKQNPVFKFPCQNPECGAEISVNTLEILQHDEYLAHCSVCGKDTNANLKQFKADLEGLKKKLNLKKL